MKTAREIADAIGRDVIAARLGVTHHAVAKALCNGKFPAAWCLAILDMADKAGIEVHYSLFNWKGWK